MKRVMLDVLFVLMLSAYVLAGIDQTPFHGDESMHIYMSRDYALAVQQRQWGALRCCPTPADERAAQDQHLSIVNGTLSRFSIGLAWDLAGLSEADLNAPWYWGMPDEWAWNVEHGSLPSDRLLRIARTPSALFTALSVAIVFLIARRMSPSRAAAYSAALIYATAPAVLLNGRRAMTEGTLLCFSALVILIALWIVQGQRRIGAYLLLGAAGGLALASKHTALIALAAAFGAVLLESALSRRETSFPGAMARLAGAGVIAGAVFLVLNPSWWGDPLGMPRRVLDERRNLLESQRVGAQQAGQAYTSARDRIAGLAEEIFFAPTQFYEVSYWQDFIGEQIAEYRASGLAGRGPLWDVLIIPLFAAGLIALMREWRDPSSRVILLWLGTTLLALLVLVPFAWQRYYLPLQPPLAVIAGIGAARLVEMALRRAKAAAAGHTDSMLYA